jgi:hypothetical protein
MVAKRSAALGSERNNGEAGISVIEFAVFLPLLTLLFAAIIDIFVISVTYLDLSHISREGLLSGTSTSVMAGSQSNLNPTLSQYKACLENTANPACAHTIIHWRIRRMFESNHMRVPTSSLQIFSVFDGSNNTVRVEVRCSYNGYLGFFKGVTLSGKATASHIGA